MMKQRYSVFSLWKWAGLLLALVLLGARPATAQAVVYGNEWIVPTQQYYKIKILKDGVYKLDYQYLTQAGISGVNPQRVQLWRRGREVAIYGGGNQTALDATTYFEFYGQRNDGKLDQAIYKGGATTQPHDLYSLYTDTAAYFLTWSATTNGRRMAQPVSPAPAMRHMHRIQSRVELFAYAYSAVDDILNVYQPWGEAGEGFLSAQLGDRTPATSALTDSIWSRAAASTAPTVEILLLGNGPGQRSVDVSVFIPGTSNKRLLGQTILTNYNKRKVVYQLSEADFEANGKINLYFNITGSPAGSRNNVFRVAYAHYRVPQTNRWFAGRKQLAFLNDSTLAGPAYYVLDSIPAAVRGFDVTDPYNVQRIEGVALSGQQRGYTFPSAVSQTRRLLLADLSQALVPRPAGRVQFRAFNAAASNFIIISHQYLMRPVGNVANPVREYAAYRRSVAGGGYDTLIVTSEQLYNQFHYGEKSVRALQNFVRWELANSPATQSNYLLLLGSGMMPHGDGDVRNFSRNRPDVDLVPTSTRGASDNFLSADWENNNYIARMPTGRVPARTPQEVLAYLAKLRTHESLGPEAWRKNILHMAGGENQTDYTEFEGYVDKYKRLAEKPLLGGTVVNTYRRSASGGTNLPVNVTIAPEVNAGVSLVTYFGHGGQNNFDLEFGDPANPTKGYNNPNKYPVFLLNGCSANQIFWGTNRTTSENWIFAENKGAVGFMADSDLGFAHDLDAFSTEFYKVAFNEPAWYGKPIPVLQAEAARRMLVQLGPAGSTVAQALNNIWLGDPALKFYSPAKPDFQIANADLQILPNGAGTVQASSPNFRLAVRVHNPGQITYDSIGFRITRRYPAGSGGTRLPHIITRTLRQAWHDSTYTFIIPNAGNVFGNNQFEVVLDYQNRVDELSEVNNTAQINFNFLQGGVTVLSPPEFAIVPTNTPRLVAQTNDPLGASRVYEMELDTVPTFTSGPAIRQTRTVTATLVPDWRPTLPTLAGRDSVVWYWRVRFQTPVGDENPDWATSSFRVIQGSPGGWSQSHHGQFRRDQLTGLSVAAPSGRWEFDEIREPITLKTRGGGAAGSGATFSYNNDGISTSTLSAVNNCEWTQPNIMLAVFNGRTLQQVRNVGGGSYDSCGVPNLRFYHFAGGGSNINSPARQAQLETLLANVRPGDYIALLSMNRVSFSTFPASLKAALTALGATRVNSLQDGDPYALVVQKGPNARPVQELTYDPTSAVPRFDQYIELNGALLTRAGRGTVMSTRIGPAQQWQTLFHTVRTPEASDRYTLRLVGIDTLGVEQVLDANVTNRTLALASISARQYPYLQLVLEMRDTLNRTAPQLEQWLVTYQGLPEGLVRRDLATPTTAYDAATLAQQAASTGVLRVPVVFQNVSALDFGAPMKARVTVRNEANVTRTALVDFAANPLTANNQLTSEVTLNVVGLTGTLTGNIVVNPRLRNAGEVRALPELYEFNNELTLPTFVVEDRNVPPTLDVAFDGQHILNGDIVSPTPTVTVQLRDDDRLRRIQGTGNFDVLLTSPDFTTRALDLTGANVRFSSDSTKGTAQLELRMGNVAPLENGIYTLEVQGRDATGKAAAAEPYRVTFEVVNESSITNIFPYPNPVTSKTRFVFTLTGTEEPRNMKIQILTLTGRVVREIMQGELGPLRIGNNITEYAWDGTDQFGDRLANGTYLYRVVLDDPGNQFAKRRTAADQAFKKEWGKLVLLR